MQSILSSFIWFGIFQAFFLAVVLMVRARKVQAAGFLAVLLFVEAIGLMEANMFYSDTMRQFPYVLGLSYPLTVLRPLLIYLFARSYFQQTLTFRKRDLLHLLPFCVYVTLFYPIVTLSSAEKLVYLSNMQELVWSDNTEGILFFIVNNGIYVAYYLMTWKILRQSKAGINREPHKHSLLIRNFVSFFLLFYLFQFTLFLLNGLHLVSSKVAGTIVMLISGFVIQIIAWFLVSRTKLPSFSPSQPFTAEEQQTLHQVLEVEKAYLNDGLTIKKLAERCALKTDRVSELLQLNYGGNFKDVINRLRVDEAKQLIDAEQNGRPLNLLGIAIESGFNNKVTFYRAFKKATGLAPSEYVKQISPTLQKNH